MTPRPSAQLSNVALTTRRKRSPGGTQRSSAHYSATAKNLLGANNSPPTHSTQHECCGASRREWAYAAAFASTTRTCCPYSHTTWVLGRWPNPMSANWTPSIDASYALFSPFAGPSTSATRTSINAQARSRWAKICSAQGGACSATHYAWPTTSRPNARCWPTSHTHHRQLDTPGGHASHYQQKSTRTSRTSTRSPPPPPHHEEHPHGHARCPPDSPHSASCINWRSWPEREKDGKSSLTVRIRCSSSANKRNNNNNNISSVRLSRISSSFPITKTGLNSRPSARKTSFRTSRLHG